MMHDWLRGLDDDAIADWANKGLLKRGAKTLAAAGAAPAGWRLDAAQAQAALDGHTQTLNGTGFAALHCDCPAYGPCHHLCAFLLGLRARVADQAASAPAGREASPPATPWLDGDADAVARAFGAAASRKALLWLAQGTEAGLVAGEGALVGELADPDEVTVRVPRAGGLAAATCTCKASTCAHRALVVLQVRREGGAPLPALPARVLDEAALARLAQTRQWLGALVLQGSAGIGPAFLDQGEALATELRQADLPRPGAVLNLLVRALRDDRAGRGGATERLPALLAALWMVLRGLGRQPMPRPFRELAGVHRRPYRRADDVLLHGIAAAVWHTRGGQRGFSVYFQALGGEGGRYLVWSVSRGEGLDPDWQADLALEGETLDGRCARQLVGAAHRLACGWVSDDGRLSAREGTRLMSPPDGAPVPVLPLPDDPAALLRRHADELRADPWRQPPPRWARLAVDHHGALHTDTALQRWSLPMRGDGGVAFVARGELQGLQARTHRALQQGLQRGETLAEVFGRIDVVAGELIVAPVSVRWSKRPAYHHLSTDWPPPAAEAGT